MNEWMNDEYIKYTKQIVVSIEAIVTQTWNWTLALCAVVILKYISKRMNGMEGWKE